MSLSWNPRGHLVSGDPASPRYRQSTHDDRHGVYWKSMKVQSGDREELCRIQGEYKREEVPFANPHDGFVRLHVGHQIL